MVSEHASCKGNFRLVKVFKLNGFQGLIPLANLFRDLECRSSVQAWGKIFHYPNLASQKAGDNLQQGLLFGAVFPVLLLIFLIILKFMKSEKES